MSQYHLKMLSDDITQEGGHAKLSQKTDSQELFLYIKLTIVKV